MQIDLDSDSDGDGVEDYTTPCQNKRFMMYFKVEMVASDTNNDGMVIATGTIYADADLSQNTHKP